MLSASASKKRHLTLSFKKNGYFNINIMYISRKNDYLQIHITFLNKLNDQSHSNLILNDFNMLNIINQTNQNENFINLITNLNLNKNLTFIKFMNFYIRIIFIISLSII